MQIIKGKVYWLSSLSIGTPSFHRHNLNTLFVFKGSTSATRQATIGYYTIDNTSMTQSTPTSKRDIITNAPRVLFVTG